MASEFMTREQAVALLNEELGIPMSLSRMNKLCALKRGPPVAAKYGRRDLHTPPDVRAWGLTLLQLVPSRGAYGPKEVAPARLEAPPAHAETPAPAARPVRR